MANIPQNCTECEYTSDCQSYYGGSMCKHEKEINKSAIEKFWARFDKPNTEKQ